MVWNARVSIRDDLVRLHESSRAADMSRDLGYSSISMGEGSLDLIVGDNPDDKRVVLGDQADGRFGISLWHRGELKYVPDVLADAEDRISATEQKNSTQDHRLDAITTLAEASRDRLDGHDTTLASHNTRIGNAQSRADSAYTLAAGRATTASVSAAHDRANAAFTLADKAFDLAAGRATVGSVTAAHDRADAAFARAGTGITNAATAKARADSAHTRIDGLNYASPGDIATLSNQVQALRSQVHHWMQTARASNPDLPPPVPN